MMIGILLALFYLIHGRKNCFGINDNVIVAECNSCNVVHDSQHFATKRAEADSPSNVSFSSVDVNGSSIAGKDDGPWIKPKPGITKPDNSKNKTKPDIRNKEVDDHPSLVPAKSIPVEINNEKPPKPRISNESYPIEIPGNGSIIKPTSNESFCFNPLNLDNVKTLRRCFCYDEICHANIDKKTSEITLNYPTGALAPLSKLSQFDCNWQTGFTSGTTIYLVDALNLPPMSNVTIGKILLPPISSRKIALVSPSSSPVSFSGSLRNSNFHAFAYHGMPLDI